MTQMPQRDNSLTGLRQQQKSNQIAVNTTASHSDEIV